MNNNYTNTETSHSASACGGGRSSVHGLDAVSLPSSQCLDDSAADLQVDDRLWGDIIQLTFGATISKWQVSISTATGEMHQCRRRLFFCFLFILKTAASKTCLSFTFNQERASLYEGRGHFIQYDTFALINITGYLTFNVSFESSPDRSCSLRQPLLLRSVA